LVVPGEEPGDYLIEGARFDRDGVWVITLEIVAEGATHWSRHDYKLDLYESPW
jgi:hypothetical protein